MDRVAATPMLEAREVQALGEDVFRVDAKADKDKVVIGGWESYGGRKPAEARWFSVELTRRTAPWAYLKGEPFRAIASLELMGVLTAVMVFAPEAEWRSSRGIAKVPAVTDNLGNTYTVQRFLSCKFPLSLLVMELSCQLGRFGLELDLSWAPRNQNQEADDLTNEVFEAFDEVRRRGSRSRWKSWSSWSWSGSWTRPRSWTPRSGRSRRPRRPRLVEDHRRSRGAP